MRLRRHLTLTVVLAVAATMLLVPAGAGAETKCPPNLNPDGFQCRLYKETHQTQDEKRCTRLERDLTIAKRARNSAKDAKKKKATALKNAKGKKAKAKANARYKKAKAKHKKANKQVKKRAAQVKKAC